MIKAHISKFEMVGLIGNPEADHKKWVRPEDPDAAGTPSYTITAKKPGTELAAEAAAALAAASLVYSWAEMNTYAKLCLKHAMELFEFANTHRGFYHDSIPQVYDFYRSWEGYDDELAWAAIWLFGATEEKTFLDKAKSFYSQGGKTNRKPFNWDNKWPGVRVLIARLNKASVIKIHKF